MKFHYLIITVLFLMSCQNSEPNRTKMYCENGNQRIEVKIQNGIDFLTYNEPTKTSFVVSNIDPINLRIAGAGIRVLGLNKDRTAMRTEIKVPENYLENDTLQIKVWYKNGDNQNKCEFNIPVRESK